MTTSISDAVSLAAQGIGCRKDRKNPRKRSDSRTGRGEAARRVETTPRFDRALTLAVAAREYIWLYDYRHGIGFDEIAAREDVSVIRVRFGVERARAQERNLSKDTLIEDLNPGTRTGAGFRLIPLFPIGAYTPHSACPHREPINQGSTLCCMVCHHSGMDAHPALRRDPQTEPAPEPKPAPALDTVWPSKSSRSHETRKQRRQRLFASESAAE
jgi:hypothetical protein